MFDFLISDVRAKLKHELFETALLYRKNPDCQYNLALKKTQENKTGEGVTETIDMAALSTELKTGPQAVMGHLRVGIGH